MGDSIITMLASKLPDPIGSAILRSDLAKSMIHSASWALVGSALAQAMSFAGSVLLARLLGASKFGELGIVISTATVFSTFAAMGLGVTASKHVAHYRVSDPERAGRMIGLALSTSAIAGAFVGVVLLGLAPLVSGRFLAAPHLASDIRLSSIMILTLALNGGQTGALSGFSAFKSLARANAIRATYIVPALYLGASRGGLRGAVLGYCLLGLLDFCVYQRILKSVCRRDNIRISFRFVREDWKVLIGFSVPVLIAGISFMPAVWVANAFLVRKAGYLQMGIFAAAFQWQTVILFLSNAVSQIGLPTLSGIRAQGDPGRYMKAFFSLMFMTATPAVLLGLPVILLSHHIMKLYGPDYVRGSAALGLICVGAILTSLNIPCGHAIWSLDAPIAGMLFALLRGGLLAAFAWWLTPMGAVGLAGAYLCMALVQTLVQGPYLYLLLKSQFTLSPAPVSTMP